MDDLAPDRVIRSPRPRTEGADRRCLRCGLTFQPKARGRPHAKFCSNRCRMSYHVEGREAALSELETIIGRAAVLVAELRGK